jgi:hypothetical protein
VNDAPEHVVPPAGEEVHLPGPTLLPLFMAVGITLAVIGTTISLIVFIVGIVIFLLTLVRWIADTRRDIDALPPEHEH